jgi:hypothetical protein
MCLGSFVSLKLELAPIADLLSSKIFTGLSRVHFLLQLLFEFIGCLAILMLIGTISTLHCISMWNCATRCSSKYGRVLEYNLTAIEFDRGTEVRHLWSEVGSEAP